MRNIFSSHSPASKTVDHDVEASNGTYILPMVEKPHNDTASATRETRPKDELELEIENLKPELKAKVAKYKDAIQPHTDEGGSAYYIGDAYSDIKEKWANAWKIDTAGRPYLAYIKSLSLSKMWHHLEYLAHWMEVTAAPPKWKFIRNYPASREERAKRTRVCKLDYTESQLLGRTIFEDTDSLRSALETWENVQTRLLIAEDLSRDVVEMLGAYYDVDPLFFLSHISDYLFNNSRDRWVELPSLDIDARNRSHFNVQYLRPRYFENEESFDQAELQSGMFNVLRRLDSDRSRKTLQSGLLDRPGASVTLTRAKASLWVQPKEVGKPLTAILLVDPTVKEGHPLWRGNLPFEHTPSMKTWGSHPESLTGLTHQFSLFDEVVYWSSKLTKEDLQSAQSDPRCLAIPVLKLILADWLTVQKYMTGSLGLVEWEMAKPHWGELPNQMDDLMKKLAPWRRNIGYYHAMVSESMSRLFPDSLMAPFDASMPLGLHSNPAATQASTVTSSQLLSLWPDFKIVKQQISDCQARIMSIQTTATNAITIEESRRAIEESRRAVKQNKNLARLTFLATIFIPLSFTSSFLSMSPDFKNATDTIKLFFILGIPITLSALITVDLTGRDPKNSICRRAWTKISGVWKRAAPDAADQQPSTLDRAATVLPPWPTTRSPSSYLRQRG